MANISIQEKINKLRSVVGISVSEGLVYCGDPASLVKFLTTFQKNLNEMMKEIRQALDKNDLDYFVIKVHALKTTARMIGAQGLSEFALSLENAGRKKDRMYIDRNIQQLFDMTTDYRDRLDFLAKQSEDEDSKAGTPGGYSIKSIIDPSEFKKAIEALKAAIDNLDTDAASMVLEELLDRHLEENDEQMVKELQKELALFDWDSMEETLKRSM